MGFMYFVFVGVSLAMDAFTVTIAKTMANPTVAKRKLLWMPVLFGLFQCLMPLIGGLLAIRFETYIQAVDHWIAFILLLFIGGNMIKEALHAEDEEVDSSIDFKSLFVLSVATSIDALTVGITFGVLGADVVSASVIAGVVTFLICIVGMFIGVKSGEFLKDKAGIVGGLILIGIGTKTLIQHLFF